MIGWYVHHHGRGHLHRARAVARELDEELTVLSSLPAEDWAAWVELPRDDDEGEADATAGGLLHWAPTDSRGHRERLARIARWVADTHPRLVVVDVSVEVTVLLRTLGVPVVVGAMPGERHDPPHELGHDLASHIVAPWPGELYQPDYLRRRADKVTYVGGISRHAHRAVPPVAHLADARPRGVERQVLLVGGGGGSAVTAADLEAARAATPGWTWTVAGPLGEWHDDLWPLLQTCDVAVVAAGQNSVADVAAAGCRAVVVPEDRPFDEQRATAEVLRRERLAVVRDTWPAPQQWPGVLDEARRLDPRWERWRVLGAARRYAETLTRLDVATPDPAPPASTEVAS